MNKDTKKQDGDSVWLPIKVGDIDIKRLDVVMLAKYGIKSVYVGHIRYAPDETVEHECAVHVIYRDGRTVCITDKVSEGGSEGEVLKEGDKVPAGVVLKPDTGS